MASAIVLDVITPAESMADIEEIVPRPPKLSRARSLSGITRSGARENVVVLEEDITDHSIEWTNNHLATKLMEIHKTDKNNLQEIKDVVIDMNTDNRMQSEYNASMIKTMMAH